MDHPYGKQYGQEGNSRAYMTMRDYRNLPYQWGIQQPVGRNPNPPRSMREYRDQWMSAPVYHVPSTETSKAWDEPRPREEEGLRYPSNQGETIHTISEKTLMREKLIILTRRLDEMEMKNQHNIYSVNELSASQPSYYNHQSHGHYGENCQENVQILNQGRPPLNVPFGNPYIQNWNNHSNLPGKPYIPPTDQQQFTPTSQQQQPLALSPVEQAVLNLSKVVDTIAKEQKVHLSNMQDEISKLSNQLLQSSEKEKEPFQGQQYQTMVNEIGLTGDTTTRTDEIKAVVTLRSGRELKTAVPELVKSAPVVTEPLQKEQSVAKEENPEDECLTETILVEQAQLQPQEKLEVELVKAPEDLQDTSVTFWPWKQKEQISALITEESSGHGTGEEPQELIFQPIPMQLNPSATAQDTKTPLPVAPSDNQVYILPTLATKPKPAAPASKDKSNPLPAAPHDSVFILPMPAAQPKPQASTTKVTPSMLVLQNIRRLVASVHAFATTSNKMANAYIAWHSGWFGCGFGFGTPGPRHF